MVGSILGALLAAAGVRGSWGKLQQYSRVKVPPRFRPEGEVVTPEGVRIPLNQAVRQEPMPGTLQAQATMTTTSELPPLVSKLPRAQRQALLRLVANDAIQLERLLVKVPNPLELKAMLLKTGGGKALENLLEKHSLSQIRNALERIDPRSIQPKYIEELVDLMIEFPVPTRKFTPQELASIQQSLARIRGQIRPLRAELYQVKSELVKLRAELRKNPAAEELKTRIATLQEREAALARQLEKLINGESAQNPLTGEWEVVPGKEGESYFADQMYQGRKYKTLDELTPQELVKLKDARKRMNNLLQRILDDPSCLHEGKYVVRITTRFAKEKYYDRETKTYTITNAYMTNILPRDNLSAATGAQLKAAWYWRTEGLPEVAILIPRSRLIKFEVPQASGSKAAGFEFITAAYPEAGQGGILQFLGFAVKVPEDEIRVIDLASGSKMRW